VQRSEARSEPASGSDIPWLQISSPRSMGRRNRRCWASVPWAMIAGAMLATPMTLTGPGAPARAISSYQTICSLIPAALPPCSTGHETAP